MTSRDEFLQRVRQAVAEGSRAGTTTALPDRDGVGVGCTAGVDLVQRFCTELKNALGKPYVIDQPDQLVPRLLEIIEAKKARNILLARPPLPFQQFDLARVLRDRSLTVTTVEELTPATCREPFFRADLGISIATHLVAETGSIVLAASLDEPRSVSLLPPVHVVLAHRSQILPDLFDLFELYSGQLPSCLSIITGPSKTGDIELRLVVGVHGPGEVHVLMGTWE
jgi:L-lactate dehydrogenase complex protein LldG